MDAFIGLAALGNYMSCTYTKVVVSFKFCGHIHEDLLLPYLVLDGVNVTPVVSTVLIGRRQSVSADVILSGGGGGGPQTYTTNDPSARYSRQLCSF